MPLEPILNCWVPGCNASNWRYNINNRIATCTNGHRAEVTVFKELDCDCKLQITRLDNGMHYIRALCNKHSGAQHPSDKSGEISAVGRG